MYNFRQENETPAILEPEHPLLEKFQKTLKEHLLKQIEHLKSEIFEFETAAQKKDADREKLGIEAYEMQQIVCKQQKQIENYMTELDNVAAAREEVEYQLEKTLEDYKKQKDELYEAERKGLDFFFR